MPQDNAIPAIRPDLQSSLLCDDVRQEINGKFILIGLFDRLVAGGGLPLAVARFCVVNRWCCGAGTFSQVTRIVAPDGTTRVAEGREVKLSFPSETATATSVEYFVNLKFGAPGVHWVEIYLGHEMKVRYPLVIELRKQP